MLNIDISTEEKRKETFELFDKMLSKGDIFKYYGVSDNTKNTNELNRIGDIIGFDFSIYNKRKHPDRFCKLCGKKLNYYQDLFCSKSCSAKYNNKHHVRTEESKRKTSKSLINYHKNNIENSDKILIITEDGDEKILHEHVCECCGKIFHSKKKNRKYCSKKCSAKSRSDKYRNNIDEYKIYHIACDFKFSLNDYPDEFNFRLIEKYGWYKAKNHGNNLNGISRDHIFSVRDGFENKIDPYYLSHPANCNLMIHNDNISKHKHSDITFEELLERIKEWENKYGIYENKISYVGIENFQTK